MSKPQTPYHHGYLRRRIRLVESAIYNIIVDHCPQILFKEIIRRILHFTTSYNDNCAVLKDSALVRNTPSQYKNPPKCILRTIYCNSSSFVLYNMFFYVQHALVSIVIVSQKVILFFLDFLRVSVSLANFCEIILKLNCHKI